MENVLDTLLQAEEFLGTRLPAFIRERNADRQDFHSLDEAAMMKLVAFEPPFLKTEKMVIFGDELIGSTSIGIGKVYPEDTKGHYNSTIYLALAGRLMPSTATIHLAYFFPETSPQAIEGKSIRIDREATNGGLLEPDREGTTFYVETRVHKKKVNLIECDTLIMFGEARFGLIEKLRFMLTKKDSIFNAIVPSETL